MKQLTENNLNNTIYVDFIDTERTLDRIPRKKVWISLSKKEINLRNAIASLHENTRNNARTGNLQTKKD